MNCKVYYVSPKGSTELIADTIAKQCPQCVKEPLLPAYMPENVPLMFLGCEGGKADKITLDFISSLNDKRVRNAALFCCSGSSEPIEQMKKALEARGVRVLDSSFLAPVKGLFGGGPKEQDLQNATKFADACLEQCGIE